MILGLLLNHTMLCNIILQVSERQPIKHTCNIILLEFIDWASSFEVITFL